MTKEEQEAINAIIKAAEVLGWQVAFDGLGDSEVEYMILGKPEVIDRILQEV